MTEFSTVRMRRALGALLLSAALTLSAACGSSDPAAQPAATTVALPDGFPGAQVPLVAGTVVSADRGASDGRTVYTVTVQASAGADEGFEQAKQLLLGGGFSVVSEGTPNGGHNVQLSSSGLFVTVSTVAGAAIPNAVQYQVTQ